MAQRCQTLTAAFLIIIHAATALAAEPIENRPAEISRQQQNIRQSIQRVIQQVKEDHNLLIAFENLQAERFGRVELRFQEAQPDDYGRVYRFLVLLQQELDKYPPDFLRPRQLRAIYLVKGLFNEDKNAQGIYDYRLKVIFFDFARQYGGELAQRHNIHHEFFHVIDTNSFYWQGKVDWEDLNPPDFQYAKKGKVHIDPGRNEANYFAPNRKGFVTYYAMMSPYEDKAEIFACLFVRSQNRLIHRWAKKDAVLRKKIAYMKSFLSTYTDGVIDDAYFSALWDDSAGSQRKNP